MVSQRVAYNTMKKALVLHCFVYHTLKSICFFFVLRRIRQKSNDYCNIWSHRRKRVNTRKARVSTEKVRPAGAVLEHDLESIDVQQTTSNDNDKIKQLERAAQLMFYGGCCLLPWVWGLSIIYFWKLYRSETCPPGIKKYITQSIQGLILVMILFGIWIVIFQTNKGERWAQPLLITPQNDDW